jgi:DNA-binding XRE family transcriptional regulator
MIYLISHSNQFLKIGYTKDIKKRLSQLQVSSPIKLELLHIIEGDLSLEKELHILFKDYATNGEWFIFSEDIVNYFKDKYCLMWSEGFIKYSQRDIIGLIRAKRIKNNLSLEHVASLYGCTPQSMYDIEKREVQGKVTLSTLYKIAKIYNKEFEYRFVDK